MWELSVPKTYSQGDTACDLSFWKFGFAKKERGDTAWDLSFWELRSSKTYGGHCLRFDILGATFSKSLRGTLLANCHFGRSGFQKL